MNFTFLKSRWTQYLYNNNIEMNKQILYELVRQLNKDFDKSKKNVNMNKLISNSEKKKLFLIVEVKNNKIQYQYDDDEDNRGIEFRKTFTKWYKWITTKNIKIGDGKIYLYITDTYYYEDEYLPILIMAKPKNRGGILFPDNSWFNVKLNKKIYDHNNLIKLFTKQCFVKLANRKNTMFFRGSNTGRLKYNTRRLLELYFDGKVGFDIKLKQKQIPNYHYCKYKILLNLPGNQPWSYRFRELLLTGSIVVNIDILVSYDKGRTFNERWIQFWSHLFKPDKHYINITAKYIYSPGNETNEINHYNQTQFNQLVDKLETLNNDILQHPNKYYEIAKSGHTLMKSITMDVVYWYMYQVWKKLAENN